jgi:hypothetical protein
MPARKVLELGKITDKNGNLSGRKMIQKYQLVSISVHSRLICIQLDHGLYGQQSTARTYNELSHLKTDQTLPNDHSG